MLTERHPDRHPARCTAGALAAVLAVALLALVPTTALGSTARAQEGDASNEALFREAEELFNSARQPDAIALFSRLLARLDLVGPPSSLDAESREFLIRSLYYRAIAQFNLGDEAPVREDLGRLIAAEPRFEIERGLVSPKFEELFDSLRDSMLGTLQLYVSPSDAEVRIDGQLIASAAEPILMLAGPHTVVVERPGHTPWQQEIELAAGETLDQEAALERISAVVRVMTRPPGVAVRLDGSDVGVTSGSARRDVVLRGEAARFPPREFSAGLLIDGIRPGQHRISLHLEGYRDAELNISVPGLDDIDAGAVVLEPLQGTIALLGVPEGASVALDGRPAEVRHDPDASDAETWLLDAYPGEYRVTVMKPGGGMFEEMVTVLDRQTRTVDVDLRPSIAFVGVLGEDEVGAERITELLRTALGSLDRWAYLDRSTMAAATVGRADLTADTLRGLASLASPTEGAVDWTSVQQQFEADLSGSLYVLAVLSDDLLATDADLWVWPSSPGPAVPDRVRLSLEDPAGVDPFVAGLERPFTGERPWFGAVVVDSDAAQGPVVVDVSADSPAAAAGLQPGDELVYIGSNNATGAGMVQQFIARSAIGSNLEIIVRRGSESVRTAIVLGRSPQVIPGGLTTQSYAAVWAASLTALASADPAIEPWVAQLNLANVLMQAGMREEAVRRLRAIEVPRDSGFAQAMVDYLLGNALEAVGPEYLDRARDAYTRAASVPDARLWHRDGPYLVPRARARLATMGGAVEPTPR